MTIVACPRCRDEVQLPARVSPQARVRCPLCRDEYILSEALAKMPPMLIVLDAGPAVDEPGYAEPEYKVAGSSGGLMESNAMGGAFEAAPALGEAAPGTAPRPLKTGARPRKKSGGAVGQILQVILGGVGAFVLFQPLAWYVLKQDPFSMGPIVAKYAPGIVPKDYHGKVNSTNGKGNGGALATNTNPPPPVPAVVQNKKGGNFDPGDKFKGLNNTKPEMTDPIIDDGPPPVLPPENTKPELKVDDPDPPSKFTPPAPKPEDPNAPALVSSTDVNAAYGFAVLKRQDFEAAGPEEPVQVRQQKGKDFYEASAELGKLLAGADLTDPLVQDKLPLVKEEITSKMSARLLMLAIFADPALADGSKIEGIAVGGVIKDIKPLGASHETTIEITRRDKTLFTLPIVTAKSLEDEGAKIGDTLIVLGKIIRDPKKELPTYKGEAPQVIKAGYTTVVPAP